MPHANNIREVSECVIVHIYVMLLCGKFKMCIRPNKTPLTFRKEGNFMRELFPHAILCTIYVFYVLFSTEARM